MQIEHGMLVIQTAVQLNNNKVKGVVLARIPCHEQDATRIAMDFSVNNKHIRDIDCRFHVQDYVLIDSTPTVQVKRAV